MSTVKVIGPPAIIEGYLVQALEGKTRSRAKVSDWDQVPDPPPLDFDTPLAQEVLTTSEGIVVGHEEGETWVQTFIPNEVLAAALKVAGWKVETP